jgi:peptide/nickel transport system substrate-binding protein
MKSKNKYLLAVLTLVFTMLLAACGAELPPPTAETDEGTATSALEVDTASGDTLVIGMSNAPASQNPFHSNSTSGDWAMKFFYETLLDQLGPTEFQPRLGKFTTEDNQVFTVEIDPEANWTDGEPVTAHDVAFTINTIAHPDTLTTHGADIAMLEGTDSQGKMTEDTEELSGVQVLDDKTLQLKTKQPVDINYISEFLGTSVMIAPEHVMGDIPKAELHTDEKVVAPTVFNGAYKFVDYQEENYLELEANEDYYRGAPKIQNVYMRVLNDAALVTELQAGNIHMVSQGGFGDVPHNDVPLVEEVEHLEVNEYPSPNVQYLYINNESERFADKRVRQALAYAIDFDLVVENLLYGHGEVPAAPYSSANSTYYDETLDPYPYDPEKAKQLLDEAGFDYSQPVNLSVPTGNAVREQNADLIEQFLEAVGVEVEQVSYDFTTFMSKLREGDYELGLGGQAHNYEPDLTNFLGTGGTSNQMYYSSDEMDALLTEGLQGTSAEERQPIYNELQALFKEDSPAIPLYSESVYSVQDKKLSGGVEEFYPATLADLHEWTLDPSEE